MNSIVKKLIRNSTILRNSITLSYYCTASSYANFSRAENLANYKLASSDEKDAAQVMNLQLETYFQNFFKKIEQSCNKMNLNEAVKHFKKLDKIMNSNKISQDVEFTDYKGFENLCSIILKNARFLKIYEVINLISTLKAMNIPYSSMLLETLFQLVLNNINMLNTTQIIKLYKILIKSSDNSTLVQSIILGLKQVFQEQALVELNSESQKLLTALAFSNKIENIVVKKHIISILCKNSTCITMDNIGIVFTSLLSEEENTFRQLLYIIKHFIKTNINHMSQDNIECMLFYISKHPVGLFNNEINMLIHYLMGGKCTLQEKLHILNHLNVLKFRSTSILDSISCDLLANPNSLNNMNVNAIIELLQAFVIGNYKPHGWETIAQNLENYMKETSILSTQQLLYSIIQLVSLDYYSPILLDMIFHKCNNLFHTMPINELMIQAFKLHSCIKLLYPKHKGEMLKENILQKIIDYQTDRNILKQPFTHLQISIVKAVNGDAYVMSKLKSKVVRTVDFVVAIRPDGSFVDLSNQNFTFVEELESVLDCNKILIYAFPRIAYCSNARVLFSTVNMQLRAMEKLPGFHTIVIDPFSWMDLSIDSKIGYLREAINSKCPNI